MSDVILVVLERQTAAAGLLRAAARLAELVGRARINVLGAAAPLPQDETTAMKNTFESWLTGVRGPDFAVQWLSGEGTVEARIEESGRRADFIVIAQPDPDGSSTSRQALRAALCHTERPLLIVPFAQTAPFGGCVAIAWRDDQRAVRAVIPALRFLARAARVHVLSGVRAGAERPALPRILIEHGIRAELHVLPIGPAPFGKDLLAKAHELGADMLVMGAHLRSPLMELMLGGVTRYMLSHTEIPVLMRH
jgi:nucleotide-binding universal stress UspA family protein